MQSTICQRNGRPLLLIDGKPTTAIAYTTYFEERNRYEDFIAAGYRIFFVNVSFTTLPINPETEFTPFRAGVFDDPHRPDYSEFENAVHKILAACPDAIIFPRIYISMPQWWIDTHPDDVIPTEKGALREILFSDTFRKDGAALLERLVRHIKASDYAHRIGGWMFCGGSTQEWFYRNFNGCLCEAAAEPYRLWVKKTYGEEGAVLPALTDYDYTGSPCQSSENAKRYSIFCNLAMAETVDHFAAVLKNATDRTQVVGTFYGYTFESRTALFGTYGLRALLSSPHLDYFSSPNAYSFARAFGIDWADMIPVDSVKAHGKLCFIECDIRTYLTTGVQEARPGRYPPHIYQTTGASVWAGPPTAELSREALRKSFAHQITKASAVWWFDMWGGWYADPLLMEDLAALKRIYDTDTLRQAPAPLSADVVFWADEQSYANVLTGSPQAQSLKCTRAAMGNTGVPYDTCMVEDAPALLGRYKAAVFPFPLPSEAGKQAMRLCEERGIPYLAATAEHYELTVDELCAFYRQNGMHFYTNEQDVIYLGNGYAALHSAKGGQKTLILPRPCRIAPVFGADAPIITANTVTFTLADNATALFRLCEERD